MLDFVAVGDVMLDVRLPAAPQDARQHGVIRSLVAGSAVNAARAAARLGATAAVVGAVGDDAVGKAIGLELEGLGIEAHLDRIDAATTGTVVYGRDGIVADRGANALFLPREVPEARVTLVSGYLPEAARARALELGRGLVGVDLQGVIGDAPGADVVVGPSLDLEQLGPLHRVACSTLAESGAEAVRGGVRAAVRPERLLDASPVGAGDAFAAALMLALADELPLEECLRRACAAAIS